MKMKPLPRLAKIYILFVFFFHNILSGYSATPDNQKIIISQIIGAKSVPIISKKEKKDGVEGSNLLPGDKIETPEKTIVRLQMYDGSILTVGQKSNFEVNSVHGDPKTIVRWVFSVTEGAVRGAITKKESQKPDTDRGIKVIIKSPTAAMGVRGTKFVFTEESQKQRATLYTEEGDILFSKTENFLPEQSTVVLAGEYSYMETKLPKPAPNKKFELKKDLAPILDYYQLEINDRTPQSITSNDSNHTIQEPMKNCIDKQLGWRKTSTETAPHMGECY